MKITFNIILLAFVLSGITNIASAGSPKSSHPCYDVAECKNETSKKDFSACIKANKEEADKNAACATFRSDKKAYMKKNGLSSLKELFE